MAKSKQCKVPTKQGQRLDHPRSSKPPFPDSFDLIVPEFEVSQRCALRQHSCKALCPACTNPIAVEFEVSQRWALPQHSCKTLCPSIADVIAAEIEVSQRSEMCQHSCKAPCGARRVEQRSNGGCWAQEK